VQILLAQQVYEWGSKSVELLYNKVAENQDPPQPIVIGDFIPVSKDNLSEFTGNWTKWLPKK
jgi:hypothetical protein